MPAKLTVLRLTKDHSRADEMGAGEANRQRDRTPNTLRAPRSKSIRLRYDKKAADKRTIDRVNRRAE